MVPCHQNKCKKYKEYDLSEGITMSHDSSLSDCKCCIYFERFNLFVANPEEDADK